MEDINVVDILEMWLKDILKHYLDDIPMHELMDYWGEDEFDPTKHANIERDYIRSGDFEGEELIVTFYDDNDIKVIVKLAVPFEPSPNAPSVHDAQGILIDKTGKRKLFRVDINDPKDLENKGKRIVKHVHKQVMG